MHYSLSDCGPSTSSWHDVTQVPRCSIHDILCPAHQTPDMRYKTDLGNILSSLNLEDCNFWSEAQYCWMRWLIFLTSLFTACLLFGSKHVNHQSTIWLLCLSKTAKIKQKLEQLMNNQEITKFLEVFHSDRALMMFPYCPTFIQDIVISPGLPAMMKSLATNKVFSLVNTHTGHNITCADNLVPANIPTATPYWTQHNIIHDHNW